MRRKYGLWWTCPMNGKPLRINGSLRRRHTLMVMSPFMKLDLSQRSFRQVQGVDCDETLSIIAMLKSVRIMLAVAAFWFTKSGRWMSKQSFLDGFREERLYVIQPGCMWYNQKVFVDPKDAKRYASSSYPSMDWSKHLGVGTYALMRRSKHLGLYKVCKKLVFARKWVGALQHFW